ncbi:MAG: hypothetical protein IT289_05475 [Oligoflexia bacterium]|nr:hypothetical protein [Oligoflexia bacterium]
MKPKKNTYRLESLILTGLLLMFLGNFARADVAPMDLGSQEHIVFMQGEALQRIENNLRSLASISDPRLLKSLKQQTRVYQAASKGVRKILSQQYVNLSQERELLENKVEKMARYKLIFVNGAMMAVDQLGMFQRKLFSLNIRLQLIKNVLSHPAPKIVEAADDFI